VMTGGVYFGQQELEQPKIGMSTYSFNHTDIIDQRIHLQSGLWSAALQGATLTTISSPYFIDNTASMMRQILQTYAYFRPNVTFKIQLNTTKFHSGKLLMCWDPLNVWIGYRENNIYSASCLPFVEIDAGDSNSAELVVPYEYFSNYWTTTCDNPGGNTQTSKALGTLRLIVLNQLKSTQTTTPVVGYQIFAQLTGSSLELPIQPHNLWAFSPTPPALVATTKGLASVIGGVRAIGSIANNVGAAVGGSSGANRSSKGANLIGKAADTVSGVANVISSAAANFFGLDKPNLPDSHQQNHLSTTTPLSYMFGPDTCVRLSTNPLAAYMDTRFSAQTADDTSLEVMVQRPSLFDVVPWSTASAAGSLIYAFPVAPMCNWSEVTGLTQQYAQMYPTWLSFPSLYYDQWSGDIIVRLSFATSQFHSGRVLVVYAPTGGYIPTTSTTDILTAQTSNPHIIFDLRENKELVFRVGYNSTTETKQCVPYPSLIGSQGPVYNSINNPLNTIMGIIQIYVMNPLQLPDGSASTVDINLWCAGGENFRYDYPNVRNEVFNQFDFDYFNTPGTLKASVRSGERTFDVISRDSPLEAPNIIKGPSGLVSQDRFGERVGDVRDLAKRPSMIGVNLPPPTATPAYRVHPMYTLENIWNSYTPTPRIARLGRTTDSFLYNFSDIFAFWSGSLRIRYVPRVSRTDRAMVLAMAKPREPFRKTATDPFRPLSIDGPLHVQSTAQDQGVEIEIPFISSMTQAAVHDTSAVAPFDDDYFVAPMISRFYLRTDDSAASVEQFYALSAGNDFALRVPVCPPTMYVQLVKTA